MIAPRAIPVLLLRGQGLVKTVKFKDPKYIGDPRNAVKIFNEKEVDELVILDITATNEKRGPQFSLLHEIVSEAFMPIGYGGGIRSIKDIEQLISLGIEKAVLNTYAVESPDFVTSAAEVLGSSSVVVCLDTKRKLFGGYEVFTHSGKNATGLNPIDVAMEMEQRGAGELIVNSIDRDGTMQGYDLDLVRTITNAVSIPVIACGGASNLDDLSSAIRIGGASAAAAGSMFVFQGKHRAVLISYPTQDELRRSFM